MFQFNKYGATELPYTSVGYRYRFLISEGPLFRK